MSESPPREWWPVYPSCRIWVYREQRYCGGDVKDGGDGWTRCVVCGEVYGAVKREIHPRTGESDRAR